MKQIVVLINSKDDIHCLKLPPVWSMKKALTTIALMMLAILLASLWILSLRRTVKRRTQALGAAIEERHATENALRDAKLRADLEEQRVRIARNIHDGLGSLATRINRLAGRGRSTEPSSMQAWSDIAGASRELVDTLDETVWTVNPSNDSLSSLANYLASYAQGFFRGTGIHCALEIPLDLPERSINAERRYHLLLFAKEALNNALKHSKAQTVFLILSLMGDQLELVIRDDGRGFQETEHSDGDGLANLRFRLGLLGGRLEITTSPGNGTMVKAVVPLPDFLEHSPD